MGVIVVFVVVEKDSLGLLLTRALDGPSPTVATVAVSR